MLEYIDMNEFLKMDIFFAVTTIAVIAVAILAVFVLWKIARILKNVEHISEQVSLEADAVREDLADMRGEVRRGKGRIASLLGFFKKATKRHYTK